MNNEIVILYKETGKAPILRNVVNVFKLKKMIVEGNLDLVRYENCIIVCSNKKQKLNLVPNIVLDFNNIKGDFLLIGYNPRIKDFRSLNNEEISFYTDTLNRKSFQYNKYKKWIENHSTSKHKRKEKLNKKNNSFVNSENKNANTPTENSNKEMLEIILNIQAIILKYVKSKMDGEQ